MSWLPKRKNGTIFANRRLPLARADELVVEAVGEELLIYDKTTNRAHCLTATAAKVWRACDGHTDTDELLTELGLDSSTLDQALDELDKSSLLETPPQIGHTRREMTIKAAKFGTAASLPLIYSVLGPVPMAAATPTPAQCLLYTSGSCSDCANICGCCCCCQSCTINAANGCKVCYPTSLCPAGAGVSTCPGLGGPITSCGTNNHCSTTPGSDCTQPCIGPRGNPDACSAVGSCV